MSTPGTTSRPLRVAIVGAGPAGFYTAQALLAADPVVEIDLFERLPAPFGLVRFGVAPDHPKIKSVTRVYHKLATRPEVRFVGNVGYGREIDLATLSRHYDQVVFCTGAQSDRRLGIPGEDLARSHPATEFVAWYNGHPDFCDLEFDLSRECAVVIGVGNVAVDVARILCRTPAELEATDIADHALAALTRSKIRRVYLLGRRGPAQAAFSNPEVKELGELAGASCHVRPEELELDPASARAVEEDRATARKLEILRSFPPVDAPGAERRLTLRFLLSPVELTDDGAGGVGGMRLVRNRLEERPGGRLAAVAGSEHEELDAGLVFRSVGYRGVPLPDLPFREDWGIVPNREGRITDGVDGEPLAGLYVAGWIKRGPSGVIGTNKPDAVQTVEAMLADLAEGRTLAPDAPDRAAIDRHLDAVGAQVVDYPRWERIDADELARGEAGGRPRVKLSRYEDLLRSAGFS